MSFIFIANCLVGTAGQIQNINDPLHFWEQFGKPAAEWDSGPMNNLTVVSIMLPKAPRILTIGVQTVHRPT